MLGDCSATQERLDLPRVVRRESPLPDVPRLVDPTVADLEPTPGSRRWRALRGLREVILIAAVYSMYDATRYLVQGKRAEAFAHASSLMAFERHLHLDPERALNPFVTRHVVLALPADYIYATLHYIVTPAVLIWLWRRHRESYNTARTTLMLATIVGLIGFSLIPVAPPRMIDGFTDTMAKFAHSGWWGDAGSAPRGLGQDTNQYAALPSLHVGWAVWCGWQMFRHGRHRLTRLAGIAYPIVVTFVVIATANHYFVDAIAGIAVIGLAGSIVWGVRSLALRLWQGTSGSPSSSSPPAPA